jgi:hypothetical protein
MDGREATSTSGENPGGIFERVPEKLSGIRIKLPIQNEKERIILIAWLFYFDLKQKEFLAVEYFP